MQLLRSLKSFIPERHPLRLLYHRMKGWLAAARHGFPVRKLRTIAVTGTDGKTTTVGMITHILRAGGRKVGAISTAFFDIDGAVRWNATQKTSIAPLEFQRFLRDCRAAGCEFVVVEASSHGIVQGRLGPVQPEVAAITNTSMEHLDYHGSMDQYRKDKGRLFQWLRGRGTKVLHRDDATFEMYSTVPSEKTITYSTNGNQGSRRSQGVQGEANFWISDVHTSPTSTSALLHASSDHRSPITDHLILPIPGAFNLENALCAIACASAVGIDMGSSVEALRTFPGVPGRLERIDEGQPFAVFVDYTVTPVAHEKTLRAVRATAPDRRLLVLTGSCGDRMREKRPHVGRIASELSDVLVITTDETYTEDPLTVIEEVWTGVDRTTVQAHKIPDRREAITFLLRLAQPGDAVVLCGMGCCTTMMTRRGQIPWDERGIARAILREMLHGGATSSTVSPFCPSHAAKYR